MWRSCPDGHLTGSTLVLDAGRTRALFTLHPKIGRWLQMGGHCEEADVDLAATALREAVEESGIDELVLLPGPIDLDVHALDCPKGRPNRHLDVRWLAVAPAGSVAKPSIESPDLRWFPLDAPPADADESTLRLVRLARGASI
jgi:8-oxo-dGTP pyrophosphatase MutT (NUDIX family)